MTSVYLRACLSGGTAAGNKSTRRQHPSVSPQRGRAKLEAADGIREMLGWDKSVKAGEPENDSPLMGLR